MLSDAVVYATVAVKDLEKAKKFYEGTLGLKQSSGDQDPGGVFYDCAGCKLFVYSSQFAGTYKATAASWLVKDLEAEIKDLKSRGVTFEEYDFPGLKTVNGIATIGKEKAAWFKDPDGNILNIASHE